MILDPLDPYRMKTLTLAILVPLVIVVVITGAALVFGGPGKPPPMSSINNPFKNIDYSDLPAASLLVARDGVKLTFRAYPAPGNSAKGSVVLVHGSSASGISMQKEGTLVQKQLFPRKWGRPLLLQF